MTVDEFLQTWEHSQLNERQGSQAQFNDLCELFNHPKPAQFDQTGDTFVFEKHVRKELVGQGFADVWKKGYFGWEYKSPGEDLEKAYQQIQQYRQDLENPRLLVVSDMKWFTIHTAFNDAPHEKASIHISELRDGAKLDVLRNVFWDPDKLNPNHVEHPITEKAAAQIAQIAESIRRRGIPSKDVAHFLDRIVFCMFAQNIGLLPRGVFTEIATASLTNPKIFTQYVGELFAAMATGGKNVLLKPVPHFNGNLFDGTPVIELTLTEIKAIESAAGLDWKKIDATIFGTLFERGLDPAKRAQLGAHYTGRIDIETIVEPVVMQPLRREWDAIRQKADKLLAAGNKKSRADAERLVSGFLERLRKVSVLDPAGGSGNFLYVTLHKLLDLEKEVNAYLGQSGFTPQFPQVNPLQLYCIEINSYAHDLAQMTVLIGYIQWLNRHGYGFPREPILKRLENNFFCKDAILDLSDPEHPKDADWPAVDFIVSNPPFLGGSKIWEELGRDYQKKLWKLYEGSVPGFADLYCYWFEKARTHIASGKCKRAGLLASQSIRGGANREVLKRIKESGDIFFAVSDRDWILDGANVHVSMVGFDKGKDEARILDGKSVPKINANLTASADTTQAQRLTQNLSLSFIGTKKAGDFNISESETIEWLQLPNPHGKPNSDILKPWLNGTAIVQRPSPQWIIDCGTKMTHGEFSLYTEPYRHVSTSVKPERDKNNRPLYQQKWWLHAETRPGMRQAIGSLPRYLATPRVSKYRIFVWVPTIVLPDDGVFLFASPDDYFFGVLHSRLHEVWSRSQGTQVRDRASGFRYTPTTCFETFPFPEATPGQHSAIATAAKDLDTLRNNWLNPSEWTREEVLEFPASASGPWSRYVQSGVARYPRIVPKDADCAGNLKTHSLTNLYNEHPQWLTDAHRKLDEAVAVSYGWPADIPDSQILEKLLALNVQKAGA